MTANRTATRDALGLAAPELVRVGGPDASRGGRGRRADNLCFMRDFD